MPLSKEIQERLAQAIRKKGLTNYKIAKELKISATTLSNYLKGKVKKPDNTKLEAICNLLGISTHWLYTGQDFSHKPSSLSTAIEEKLNQIALQLQSKDDQYLNLHKDLEYIRKFILNLYKETISLKEEVKKLREDK